MTDERPNVLRALDARLRGKMELARLPRGQIEDDEYEDWRHGRELLRGNRDMATTTEALMTRNSSGGFDIADADLTQGERLKRSFLEQAEQEELFPDLTVVVVRMHPEDAEALVKGADGLVMYGKEHPTTPVVLDTRIKPGTCSIVKYGELAAGSRNLGMFQ